MVFVCKEVARGTLLLVAFTAFGAMEVMLKTIIGMLGLFRLVFSLTGIQLGAPYINKEEAQ